jgi:hypothetical protein
VEDIFPLKGTIDGGTNITIKGHTFYDTDTIIVRTIPIPGIFFSTFLKL